MKTKEYIRDLLYEKLGIVIDKLGTLIVFVVMIKFLSPKEFGKLSLILAIGLSLTISLFVGPAIDIARERDLDKTIEKLNCYLPVTILLAFVIDGVAFLVYRYLFSGNFTVLDFLEMLLFSFSAIFIVFSAQFLISQNRFAKEGLIYAVRGLSKMLFSILLVPYLKTLGIALTFFLSSFMAFSFILGNFRPKLCNVIKTYLHTLYLSLLSLLVTINVILDQTIIAKFLGFSEVAYYNIIDKLANEFRAFNLGSITIGKGKLTNPKKHWANLKKVILIYVSVIGIILLVGYWVLKFIIPYLNPKYLAILNYYYLVFPLIIVYLLNVFSPMLITYKLERYLIPIFLLAIVINLLGDLALVPSLGLEGAVLATIFSEGVYLIGSYLLAKAKLRI